MEINHKTKLILASGSPRRAKILQSLGVDFEIVKSDAPEVAYPGDPERTVSENAIAKGAAARASLVSRLASCDSRHATCDTPVASAPSPSPSSSPSPTPTPSPLPSSSPSPLPILSADTIVWLDGRIYGKPRDLDEAREFLRWLSGRTHSVFTGVALDGDVRVVRSDVKFRALSESDVEEYVMSVRPLDRAGAYDIDERGDLIVESYTGSYENIMGLPVEPLKEWGIV
ncbi:MAG: septum formation protein Maf [Kiritimatiellae bacterium]|nr:septum formation protein Maf [Kiritimatiellia bacterium]